MQAEGEPGLSVPSTQVECGPSAPDAFFAETQLTYFDFVPACVGIAQVAILKEDTLLAKVRMIDLAHHWSSCHSLYARQLCPCCM